MVNELCIQNDLVLNLNVIRKQIEQRITAKYKQELVRKLIEVAEVYNNQMKK